ncbi:hypothetical protein BV898_06461 [Hypsibius exemplaris]|uniref:Uncharacterized protein n=1 Tax=Hypsibius exemplaris TaxID=2072580 RepID=A0A1W0WW98_HYPEX|nr:hypothetical protein BV898_06461 [Hypsibius exemplaris]
MHSTPGAVTFGSSLNLISESVNNCSDLTGVVQAVSGMVTVKSHVGAAGLNATTKLFKQLEQQPGITPSMDSWKNIRGDRGLFLNQPGGLADSRTNLDHRCKLFARASRRSYASERNTVPKR